jgi:S1-C subfamily serine protease
MKPGLIRTFILLGGAVLIVGLIVPNLRLSWREPRAVATPPGGIDPASIHPEEVFARAAAIASPSVVNIDTEKRVRLRGSMLEEEFFGPRYQRVAGSGSGVIIHADGDIVTNEHVVSGAEKIVVTLADGRQFDGRVIGGDRRTDVALVKIEGDKLPVAKLGSSAKLIPGQISVAIGNPLGLRFTVTHGIISALGRPIGIGERIYEDLIQTDTAINPGNSGGALVDREGKVIGINTLVDQQAHGIGFAIPIDTAMRIVGQLKRYGKVKRPWTGLYAMPITRMIQARFGVDFTEGAFVQGLDRGSPADEAGISPGDVILELNGEKVLDPDSLRQITDRLKIGQTVPITIYRRGERLKGEITLREAP